MSDCQRLHQLVLVWIDDAPTFGRYLEALGPVVTRYGGAADQVYVPTAIRAAGLDTPDAVNLVHYDDEAAYRRFSADPDFLAIKPLRDASVRMLSFEGKLETSIPSVEPRQQQLHHIEVGAGRELSLSVPGRSDAGVSYLMRVTGHPDDYPAEVVRISSGNEGEHRPTADTLIYLKARLAG